MPTFHIGKPPHSQIQLPAICSGLCEVPQDVDVASGGRCWWRGEGCPSAQGAYRPQADLGRGGRLGVNKENQTGSYYVK